MSISIQIIPSKPTMKTFKEFYDKDIESTHAIERSKERSKGHKNELCWTQEKRNLFTNATLERTLIVSFTKSLGDLFDESLNPDYKGHEFFIFQRYKGIPLAAIGVFKRGFKPGEGLKIIILTYYPIKYKLAEYVWKDVVWSVKVISNEEVEISPEKIVKDPPDKISSTIYKLLLEKNPTTRQQKNNKNSRT